MLALTKGKTMDKTTYDRKQSKIAIAKTGIATSKSYRQVALRGLCKHMKVPADSWRGLSAKQIETLESLSSTLIAYGKLTPKQWGLSKRILATHK